MSRPLPKEHKAVYLLNFIQQHSLDSTKLKYKWGPRPPIDPRRTSAGTFVDHDYCAATSEDSTVNKCSFAADVISLATEVKDLKDPLNLSEKTSEPQDASTLSESTENNLESELKMYENNLAELNEKHTREEQKINKAIREKLFKYSEDLRQKMKELDELQKSNANLVADQQKMRACMKKAEKSLQAENRRVAKLKSVINNKDQEITDISNNLEDLKTEKERMKKDFAVVNYKCNNAVKDLNSMKVSMMNSEYFMTSRINKLKQMLGEKEEALSTALKESKAYSDTLKELLAITNELRESVENDEKKLAFKVEQISSLNAKNKTLESTVGVLQDDLKHTRELAKQYELDIKAKDDTIRELRGVFEIGQKALDIYGARQRDIVSELQKKKQESQKKVQNIVEHVNCSTTEETSQLEKSMAGMKHEPLNTNPNHTVAQVNVAKDLPISANDTWNHEIVNDKNEENVEAIPPESTEIDICDAPELPGPRMNNPRGKRIFIDLVEDDDNERDQLDGLLGAATVRKALQALRVKRIESHSPARVALRRKSEETPEIQGATVSTTKKIRTTDEAQNPKGKSATFHCKCGKTYAKQDSYHQHVRRDCGKSSVSCNDCNKHLRPRSYYAHRGTCIAKALLNRQNCLDHSDDDHSDPITKHRTSELLSMQ